MKHKLILIGISILFFNVACSPTSDVKNWVQEQKEISIKNNQHKKQGFDFKLKEFNYKPPKYVNIDPFNPLRKNLSDKNLGRSVEILENFDLNELNYLGYLKDKNETIAYIEANNIVYNVHVGNYVGKNSGKIKYIQPTKVVIEEIISNSNGENETKENEIVMKNSL